MSTHCTSRVEDPPPQLREHCGPSSTGERTPRTSARGLRDPILRPAPGRVDRAQRRAGDDEVPRVTAGAGGRGAGAGRREPSRDQAGDRMSTRWQPGASHPRPANLTPVARVPGSTRPQVAVAGRLGPALGGTVVLPARTAAHRPPHGTQAAGGGALGTRARAVRAGRSPARGCPSRWGVGTLVEPGPQPPPLQRGLSTHLPRRLCVRTRNHKPLSVPAGDTRGDPAVVTRLTAPRSHRGRESGFPSLPVPPHPGRGV